MPKDHMPRSSSAGTIDSILEEALRPVIQAASEAIATMIANAVAARLEAVLPKQGRIGTRTRAPVGRPARKDLTKWVADRRARRVPNFVIAMTGLKTKQQIVAKFGANVAFEKGKALAKVGGATGVEVGDAKASLKAKPPIVRKKAAAA
jgi:hypothetical protein